MTKEFTHPNHRAFPNPENSETEGLSKREYFAAAALQGLAGATKAHFADDTAMGAVVLADALIAALNKEPKTP